MNKMTVRDISLENKHVLMRVDFNVPMANGVVTDDKRIKAALPTIEYVIGNGASLVLMSHLGRPKGGPEPKYSLKPVATYLGKLPGISIQFADDCIGPAAAAAGASGVVLLENLRFHPEEEKNDDGFLTGMKASLDAGGRYAAIELGLAIAATRLEVPPTAVVRNLAITVAASHDVGTATRRATDVRLVASRFVRRGGGIRRCACRSRSGRRW